MTLVCTIANVSPLPRQHWAVLTVPRARAESMPVECTFVLDDGRRWRAVRGRSVGLKTVFRVRAFLSGNQAVRGSLQAEKHPDAGLFRAHPWVADDLVEMIPALGTPMGNSLVPVWAQLDSVQEVDSSPAHKRFRLEQSLGFTGLRCTMWVDLLHDDPVAPFTGRVVWSDRHDVANLRQFQYLLMKCGEAMAFDFARRNGIQDPVPQGRDWVSMLNSGPINLGDGVALPLSGRILSFVSNEWPAPADPADPFDPGNRGIADLMAAAQGPVLGVCHEWEDSWLAGRKRARFNDQAQDTPFNLAASEWANFRAMMTVPAGWFAERPFGLTRTPGQTGNQSDFGATKGTSAVVAMDPRAIYAMQYSAQGDCLRGYTHFEADGRPLSLEQHPSWVTWSRRTHWNGGVSPDRLGKDSMLPFPTGTYEGIDDEHASMNYVAAYCALADDPLLEDQVRHLLTTDRAGYRFRFPNNGAGVTRAQGRTTGMFAQLACVADDATAAGYANLLVRRFAQTANVPEMNGSAPMRVPAVGGPDPRKTIYDLQGNLTRYVCMWELGLFLVGHMQAIRTGRTDIDIERARAVALIAAETMAQFGFFQQGGQWFTVWDIMWNGGEAPPGGLVHPSPHITSAAGAGDVGSWTFAGAVAARQLLPRENPHWARLNEYVLAITGGREAGSREAAEWWAIADAIVQAP